MSIKLMNWEDAVLFRSDKATTAGQAIVVAHRKGVSLYGLVHEGPIQINNAQLEGLKLSGARLQQLAAEGASLAGAYLSSSHITLSSFAGADLFGANFDWARLGLVSFEGADLTEASFVEAKLVNVDFTGATFRRTRVDRQLTLTGLAKTINTRLGQILVVPETNKGEPYIQIGCTGYVWSVWQTMKPADLYDEFRGYSRELVRMFYNKWMPVVASMIN